GEGRVLVRGSLRVKVIADRRDVVLLRLGADPRRPLEIDAPEMANTLFVLRILADADVEPVLMDDRGRQEIAARAGAAEPIDRFLGVAIEFPDQLAGLRLEGIQPTVAAREDDLRRTCYLRVDGVRPLPVHDLLAGSAALPGHFARLLVQGKEA